MIITWERGIFKKNYELYANATMIGVLTTKTWSVGAAAIIEGEEYRFEKAGVFSSGVHIISGATNSLCGKITFNFWKNKTRISLDGQPEYEFAYNNIWRKKWRILQSGTSVVAYSGNGLNGTIDTDSNNMLLIICGLYISIYIRRQNSNS